MVNINVFGSVLLSLTILWAGGVRADEAHLDDAISLDANSHLVLANDQAEAALVLFPGAYFPAERYLDLARSIQQGSHIPLAIYIARFAFNVANPLEAKQRVQAVIQAMAQRGLRSPQKRVFVAGHSEGGVMASMAAKSLDLGGLILLASYVPHTMIFGSTLQSYPLPVLTLGGELDGKTGIPFLTREYNAYLSLIAAKRSMTYQKPVIILPKINHMSFADGGMLKGDLQAESDTDEAHAQISQVVNAFIDAQMNQGRDHQATRLLDGFLATTAALTSGLRQAMAMDLVVCETLQGRVAGYAPGQPMDITIKSRVYDRKKDSLWFMADKPRLEAVQGRGQVYVPAYLEYPINISDISANASLAPAVVACKMKSREALDQQGLNTGLLSEPTCSELNAQVAQATFDLLSQVEQKERFIRKHGELEPSPVARDLAGRLNRLDLGALSITSYETSRGDEWLSHLFKFGARGERWMIDTASLKVKAANNGSLGEGVYYCKVIAPSRVMEWLLLDGLQ